MADQTQGIPDLPNPFASPAPSTAPTGGGMPGGTLPNPFAPAPVVAAPAPRSALGEIGTGLARGALVDLPSMVGAAAQYATPTGSTIGNWGMGVKNAATARGLLPQYTLDSNTADHNVVTRSLAQGAEMVPAVAGAIGAGLGAAALAPEGALAGGAAFLAGTALPAVLGAGQAGQQTLDTAAAKGLDPASAAAAARINAGITFGAQTALGAIGGKLLNAFGSTVGKAIGTEGTSQVENILQSLTTGPSTSALGVAKSVATTAGEVTGINAVQAGATSLVNNQYGVDNTDPLAAMASTVEGSLGMSAFMAPLGIAGKVMNAKDAQNRTAQLTAPETPAPVRSALANQYANALAAPGTPEAQASAAAFLKNANVAIANKMELPVSSGLFVDGAISPPASVPLLENNPSPIAMNPAGQAVSGPGIVPDQQAATQAAGAAQNIETGVQGQGRNSDLVMPGQPDVPLLGNTPPPVITDAQGRAVSGPQNILDAITNGEQPQPSAVAETGAQGQGRNSEQVPQAAPPLLENNPNTLYTFPDGTTSYSTADVDSFVNSLPESQQNAARARLMGLGAQPADSVGAAVVDTNAPKAADTISSDVAQVSEANGLGTKPQALRPFEKRLAAMGVNDAATHADQIDIVTKAAADTSLPQGVRDRMDALATAWRSEAGLPSAEDAANAADAAKAAADESPAAKIVNAITGPQPDETKPLFGNNLPDAAPDNTQQPAALDVLGTNIPANRAPDNTQQPPEAAAALGTNIEPRGPDGSPAPPQAGILGENILPSTLSAAATTADKVDAALVALNDRARAGETLPPLEQERMSDLQSFRQTLARIAADPTAHPDDYVQDMTKMADQAASAPYKKTFRHYVAATPDTVDRGLMLDAVTNGKLASTLATIMNNSATKSVADYARRLFNLNPDTTIGIGTRPPAANVLGEMDPVANHIDIFRGGETEQTILHEATHAVTNQRLTQAAQIVKPRTQDEARLQSAFRDMEALRNTARGLDKDDHYGLTNAHEFVAEVHTNPEFQEFLRNQKVGQTTLWGKTVAAVRKLLGMQDTASSFLDKAMSLSNEFFTKQTPTEAGFPLRPGTDDARLFNRSPSSAMNVTDGQYSKMSALADKLIPDAGTLTRLDRNVFQKLLGWKTVQYIVDRAAAIPDFVKSGLAQNLRAYDVAHETKTRVQRTITPAYDQYAAGVKKILSAAKSPDEARNMSHAMSTIGGEASRGGFDYKLNFADNVRAGNALDVANKDYVDGIHRQYTQLKRSNPEAAAALEQGEKLNRDLLVRKTATITGSLMDATINQAERQNSGDLQALKDFAAAHRAGLDMMSKANADMKPGGNMFHTAGAQLMHGNLAKLFSAAATDLPAGALKDHLAQMDGMYRSQVANPYFSLGRDGNYFVKIAIDPSKMTPAVLERMNAALKGSNKVLGNLNGEDHAFFRVDTMDQMQGMYDKLMAAGGEAIAPGSAKGMLADRSFVSASGVPQALRNLLGTLHDSVPPGTSREAADSIRDRMTQQVLSMLPETSSRSAVMKREGVPGYDADFLSNFSKRAAGGLNETAALYTQRAFSQSLNGMQKSVEAMNRNGASESAVRGQMIVDEVARRYSNMQKPVDNTMVNTINGVGNAYYLAMSPAYLIRTMAQPLHRGLPLLGSRFGMVNASREIAGATADAIQLAKNTYAAAARANGVRGLLDAKINTDGMKLTPTEKDFVNELYARGTLDLGQMGSIMHLDMKGSQGMQDATRLAGMTAQTAEMTNRLIVGLAAFRLAQKGVKGMTDAQATERGINNKSFDRSTEYAVDAMNKTMDNFDQYNTARQIGKHGIAGSVTPLLTAFMNYNLQTMQQIARTAHDGFFSKDPSVAGTQRGVEARKELGALFATTAMISGTLGLPFANVFAGVWNQMNDWFGDGDVNPTDIRMSVQKFYENTLGHTGGQVASHGLPAALNFDSSTFGLENLLPGSEFLSSRQLMKDRVNDAALGALGPAISGALNIANGVSSISEGNVAKGVITMLPSGLKPFAKAEQLAEKGYTDSKDNKLPMSAPTFWDIGRQAVGFNSADRADEISNQGFNAARNERLAAYRSKLGDKLYKGVEYSNPAETDDATKMLVRYNAANPTQPISDVNAGLNNKLTSYALGLASGTGVGATARGFPSMVQSLLQADQQDIERSTR